MPLPLHDVHAALGACFAPDDRNAPPLDYGDVRLEHARVRTRVGLSDCSDGGRIHGSGPDIGQVLQGVVTNEVKHLPTGGGCLAVLLNDVGRARTLLEVLRVDDGYLIETPPGLAEASRDMIDYYIITEDAAVDDVTSRWGTLTLQGPRARTVLAALVGEAAVPGRDAPEHTHTAASLAGVAVHLVRRTRTGEDGYDIWAPVEGLEAVWTALLTAVESAGGGPVGHRALEVLRIEAAIPRFGTDLDDTVIPLETGLFHAISENKGCYLGQEIIARIINLSKPVRTFVGLLPERRVTPGAALVHNGKDVGRVTSAADSPTVGGPVALGYLRTDLVARGIETVTVRETAEDGGEIAARVHAQPFHRAADAPVPVVPPSPTAPKLFGGLPLS